MIVVEVEGNIVEPYDVQNLAIIIMPTQRCFALVKADQDLGNYWATTSVRYRQTAPTGYIGIRYKGAPEANRTLDGDFPSHPALNVTQTSIDLENNLFTKNTSSFDDADVPNADPDSICRIIAVGTQVKDEVLVRIIYQLPLLFLSIFFLISCCLE